MYNEIQLLEFTAGILPKEEIRCVFDVIKG